VARGAAASASTASGESPLRRAWRVFRRDRVAVAALGVFAAVAVIELLRLSGVF